MKKLFGGILMIGLIGLLVTSCGKYPDGPGFSLKTKKGRLAGEWEVEKYIDSSGVETTPTTSETYTFERDGVYKVTSGSFSVAGTWEFTDDKESLKTTYALGSSSFTSTAKILRLTNKEFWMEDEDSDKIYLKAKD